MDEKSSNKTKKGKGKIKVAEPEEEEDDTEEEATGLPTFAGVQTEDLDDEDESDNEGFDGASHHKTHGLLRMPLLILVQTPSCQRGNRSSCIPLSSEPSWLWSLTSPPISRRNHCRLHCKGRILSV